MQRQLQHVPVTQTSYVPSSRETNPLSTVGSAIHQRNKQNVLKCVSKAGNSVVQLSA